MSTFVKVVIFLTVSLFLVPFRVSAGVVINEFLPNPSTDANEWVELYNTGSDSIDLSTYSLEDAVGSNKALTGLGSISPGGFAVYEYSGGDGWLNNGSGDTLFLKDSSGTNIDQYEYLSDPGDGITFGRYPDGTGSFIVLSGVSRGGANSAPPTSTPTSTLTPTPIPPTETPTPTPQSDSPTSTPTSTTAPTNTPTSTPTPTSALSSATATPTKSSAKTPTVSPSKPPTHTPSPEDEGEVLSASSSSVPTPSPETEDDSRGFFSPLVISLSFVGVGTGLLAILFVWNIYLTKKKKSKRRSVTSFNIRAAIGVWGPVIVWMAVIFAFSSRESVRVADQEVLNFLFFKFLHVLEYAILYGLIFRAFKNSSPDDSVTNIGIRSFLLTILYAASDETHQTFVPTREGRARDVIIDGAGALWSWIILTMLIPKAPKKLGRLARRLGIL
ncbi:MAG: VanZ family protein [bacterium]|nr:VanZ family protein [bacterium]